ncbi:MAG: SUMF1/EgtB/PvdO family nonheme iron enzyme, partial [Planctomycetota bacterium]|nr:SUMF1/EgtB/PvdO family nonheme iron enzyme [Planctomycetota bacterium]
MERILKWTKRNPVKSGGGVLVAVALVAITGFWWRAIQAEAATATALKTAEAERDRANTERDRAEREKTQVLQLSDGQRLKDLIAGVELLWPARPEMIPRMEVWLTEAQKVASRHEDHRKAFHEALTAVVSVRSEGIHPGHLTGASLKLIARVAAHGSGNMAEAVPFDSLGRKQMPHDFDSGPFEMVLMGQKHHGEKLPELALSFPDYASAWRIEQLALLIQNLEAVTDSKIGQIAAIQSRLDQARIIEQRSVGDHQVLWEEAVDSIANPEECPLYQGLKMSPQVGLVPVGRDSSSGFWEFAALETGEIPTRDSEGNLRMRGESGLVFVLLPGGEVLLGEDSVAGVNSLEEGKDIDDELPQLPIHKVTLQPFFLAKTEMTQAQWQRVTKENPSNWSAEWVATIGGTEGAPDTWGPELFKIGEMNPVESVSWSTASRWMGNLALTLPTEDQWEYAARSGSTTAWPTGNESGSLAGFANLCDKSYAAMNVGRPVPIEEDLDDGFAAHAPIAQYRPNAFGLHDIIGNVWEWTARGFGEMGLDMTNSLENRFYRGGGFTSTSGHARTVHRHYAAADFFSPYIGLRPARP